MEPEMTIPKPRAVIFDWDDTIVDNWKTALLALNTALKHMGHPEWTDEEARSRAGGSAKDLFGGLFGDRWQEADKVYYETFNKLVLNNIRIHDDAENILKTLHDQGVYLAVVSNKRGALLRSEAQHIGFSAYFNKIVGAGDAAKDKPNVDPVLFALEGSGIEPGPDVWFIGDSQVDMQCAINAGCSGILIETKLPAEEHLIKHPPKARFKTHKNLMEYIKPYFS